MTKRKKQISPAEAQRRANQQYKQSSAKALRNNNGWNDCQDLYAKCADLLRNGEGINAVLEIPGIKERIEDQQGFYDSLGLFAKDQNDLSGRLAGIQAQHAGRKGSCLVEDDFIKSIQIYEQYIQFMEVWRLTVQPVFNVLCEHLAKAETRLLADIRAVEAQAQASDPNHTDPIDVSFKETPVNDLPLEVLPTHSALVVETKVTPQGEEFVGVTKARGETTPIVHIDEAGLFPQNALAD